MDEKLTSFDEFKRLRDQQREQDRGETPGNAAQSGYAELVALVNETARLVQVLDDGLQRDLAKAVAGGEVVERGEVADLVRNYERLSWRLYGQLRSIIDSSRKA